MSIRWSNGGPLRLGAQLEAKEQSIISSAESLLQEVVADADRAQDLIIQNAVTETGLKRQRTEGRSPGRIDTGLMVNSTTARVQRVDNNEITGTWGWHDPENYFLYQDYGTNQITPASSLLKSFISARIQFQKGLRALVRNGGK